MKGNCVDKQVESMQRSKKDIIETHCKNCKMVMTLVYGMMGIAVLETLMNNKN